jgi:FtsZ-binding cell division protein ZapB
MPELLKVSDCFHYEKPYPLSIKKGGEYHDASDAWVEDYEVIRDYLKNSVNDTINLLQIHEDLIKKMSDTITSLQYRIDLLEEKEILFEQPSSI